MRDGESLAAREQLAQRLQAFRICVEHRVEQPARKPERGHALAADQAAEIRQALLSAQGECQPGTVQQWPPDLECRGIERDRRILQEHLVRPEIGIFRTAHKAGDGPLRHGDRFRAAGRAGGVHHIGKAAASTGADRRGVGCLFNRRTVPIQQDQAGASLRKVCAKIRAGDESLRPGMLQHEAQPFRRVCKIEREIGAPGFQDAEHRHDQVERTLQPECDQGSLAQPDVIGEIMRQTVGPALQRAIGHILAIET